MRMRRCKSGNKRELGEELWVGDEEGGQLQSKIMQKRRWVGSNIGLNEKPHLHPNRVIYK